MRQNRIGAAVHPFQAEIDRLLAKHGFARGDRLFDVIGMRVGHRRDKDRIYIRRGKYLVGRSRSANAVPRRDSLRGRFVDIIDGGQFRTRMRGDVCRMHPADPTTAEHSNPEQEILPV